MAHIAQKLPTHEREAEQFLRVELGCGFQLDLRALEDVLAEGVHLDGQRSRISDYAPDAHESECDGVPKQRVMFTSQR